MSSSLRRTGPPRLVLCISAVNQGSALTSTVMFLSLDEASENIRTGPPRIDKDDRELDVWVGAVPLQQTVGNPLDDPKLRSGVPVP